MAHFTSRELRVLRELRERFLVGEAGRADYWQSPEHLDLYDLTYGERIGWKWDAVLTELRLRGWRPRSTRLLDWGCGTGVAHRRVLGEWPQFTTLALHDRSPRARFFSAEKVRAAFPGITVSWEAPVATPGTLLLISHVINELLPADFDSLLDLARRAEEVIWVEAGTHADSRRLIQARELLRGEFTPIAPCTHGSMCGMIASGNVQHWCHHFGTPPSAIFQDGRWAEFAREIGIDLRSVPYSFLVLGRSRPMPAGWSRVIGVPREAKGYARVLSCQQDGVGEFTLQKRDSPALFRTVRKGELKPVYRWSFSDGKIVGGEPLASGPGLP
jgi:hypothetical protein